MMTRSQVLCELDSIREMLGDDRYIMELETFISSRLLEDFIDMITEEYNLEEK